MAGINQTRIPNFGGDFISRTGSSRHFCSDARQHHTENPHQLFTTDSLPAGKLGKLLHSIAGIIQDGAGDVKDKLTHLNILREAEAVTERKVADLSKRADVAFKQNDLDAMQAIVQESWELPETPEAKAVIRHIQILDGEMVARKRLATPATQAVTEGKVETGKSITMKVYRGVRAKPKGVTFATDAGDLGAGAYWTNYKPVARVYGKGGKILTETKTYENPLVLTSQEAIELSSKYKTVNAPMEKRLAGARQMSEDLRKQGYDALIVKGYDVPKGYLTVVDLARPTEPKAKEVWEMTEKEAWAKEPKIARGKHAPERPGVRWLSHRKEQIRQALSEGKPIPRNVLKEYKGEKWAQEALVRK